MCGAEQLIKAVHLIRSVCFVFSSQEKNIELLCVLFSEPINHVDILQNDAVTSWWVCSQGEKHRVGLSERLAAYGPWLVGFISEIASVMFSVVLLSFTVITHQVTNTHCHTHTHTPWPRGM